MHLETHIVSVRRVNGESVGSVICPTGGRNSKGLVSRADGSEGAVGKAGRLDIAGEGHGEVAGGEGCGLRDGAVEVAGDLDGGRGAAVGGGVQVGERPGVGGVEGPDG